jgi:A/G-specific adenine glycosylase
VRHGLDADPVGIVRIRSDLGRWYDANRRDLPWRRSRDPYAIWVSETMLQQTQVATVIPYYERWMACFADVCRLAAADLQAVLKSWEGLGYYSRARHFHRASQIVVREHGGRVPADPAAFGSLPGVGPYIAAAVLSIAFRHPLAVVDGNVKRVLARFLQLDFPVNASGAHKVFAPIAAGWLDVKRPGRFNQAMMELGALVCTPRQPRCRDCPIHDGCRSLAHGSQTEYPRRLARRAAPTHRLATGVVRRNGRVLIVQRPAEGLLGGLWEFPAVRLADGQTTDDAGVAAISALLGIRLRFLARAGRIRHAYTHFKIEAEVLCCLYAAGRVRCKGLPAHRWVKPGELADFPLTGAAHKVRQRLAACAQTDS